MPSITADRLGAKQLLMGNEAIARGALEAGIGVAAAYPGNPSSEIIATLAQVAEEMNLYAEWSVNEKVALEVATAASLSGVRALCAMKQNGLNVALDFLSNMNLTGVKSGLLLVVCDDPGGISSTNEQDSRHVAKILDLPLLEPASFQEAKNMTKWAFELSEEIGSVCILRSVTRISHARGNVILGELPRKTYRAGFDTSRRPYASIVMSTPPVFHRALHGNLEKIRNIFETSPFNTYLGPENPELLVVTCGSGWLYTLEAVKMLAATERVGVLKLGTTWPLPRNLVGKHLLKTARILVIEEIDEFLETNLKELAADLPGRKRIFYGKASGHLNPYGELNPDLVINALARILNVDYSARPAEYERKAQQVLQELVPPRALQFCAGCPHRTTFWAIKNAIRMDGRDGFVVGDIGCYSMALTSTGFSQIKTVHAMGSGVALASGLGKLDRFGFDQPVVAVCGDSTFFHAAIPALINSIHSNSDLVFVVLDNSATAMTGFQAHPGIEENATGGKAPKLDIEAICRALGITVVITDAYDYAGTTQKMLELLRDVGKPRVLISRRECALARSKREKPEYKVRIDPDLCRGDNCGCNKFCVRVFRCPGLIWDRDDRKAMVDEAICIGCGVCVEICPQTAIVREAL